MFGNSLVSSPFGLRTAAFGGGFSLGMFSSRLDPTVQGGGGSSGGVIPTGRAINVGGLGEIPKITNLNIEQVQSGSNIPNLVNGNAQNIGEIFAPNSANLITANRFPASGISDWNQFGQGAYTVLESGGQLDMYVTVNGSDAINPIVNGLNNAGFQNVNATPMGDPRSAWIYRITGNRP